MITKIDIKNKILRSLKTHGINSDNLIYVYEILKKYLANEEFSYRNSINDKIFYESLNLTIKLESNDKYFNCIIYNKENFNVINILYEINDCDLIVNEILEKDEKIFLHTLSKDTCHIKYLDSQKFENFFYLIEPGIKNNIINTIRDFSLLLDFPTIKGTTIHYFDVKDSYYEVLKRIENTDKSVIVTYADKDGIVKILE